MTQYIAQYQLIKKLGAGVFGEVFLAKGVFRNQERIVAIKRLHSDADQESKELLALEYQLLQQVRHRCIVRVFEYFPQENAVVMEYIKGVELREVIDTLTEKAEKIFVDTAVEIGCELADALFYAYTSLGRNGKPLQLVHRDIKPSNIIMTEEGAIKILDFGLARVDNDGYALDNSDVIRGTPIYMAPEQVLKKTLDHRTDLFALGLTLYELLMGTPAYRIPYDSADPIQSIFQDIKKGHFNFDMEGLKRRLPNIGPTITKLLAYYPEDRFQNGQELLIALREQLPKSGKRSYIEEFARYYFSVVSPKIDTSDTNGEQKYKNKSIIEILPPKKHTIQSKHIEQRNRKNQDSSFIKQTSGVHMSDKPKPPVGGAAFRSNKDARSPQDDGMIDFVPMAGSADDDGESATQFFTISPPKQNTTAEHNASLDPNAGNMGQFGGGGSNSGGFSNSPYGGNPGMNSGNFNQNNSFGGIGQGGIGQGGGGQGGIGQGGIGQGGIGQGGFASGGGQHINQNVHPQVSNTSTQMNSGEASMKSNRIWVILASVFVLILISAFTVIYINQSDDKKPEKTTKETVEVKPIQNKPDIEEEEEEEEEVVAKPKKPRKPRKPKVVTAAPKKATGGTLTVKITGGDASQVTLSKCGKRQRAKVSGNRVSFSNVPVETCSLKFSPSGVFTTVKGGAKTVSCSIKGNSAICR